MAISTDRAAREHRVHRERREQFDLAADVEVENRLGTEALETITIPIPLNDSILTVAYAASATLLSNRRSPFGRTP